MSRRLLVLSARMGAGHDAVAGELARRLRAGGHQVRRADVLDLLPAGVGDGLEVFYRTAVRRASWVYGGLYAAFFRPGAGPRPGSAPLAALAAGPLLDLVACERPDAVVPVFHLAAQVTGRLRAGGALRVPSTVVVTDVAVHRQWLHPGNDLYLCVTPDAAAQVRRTLGRPAAAPGPVVPPGFGAPAPGADRWRRLLRDRCGDRTPVLVSAGAWGVGARLAATARTLAAAGYAPAVLCGRDDRLRRRLAALPGTVALGWVEDLPGLMAAAGALVDNAAGQTAMQALAAGLPVVGHRPIPGHGAEGVRRMARLGLSDHARDPWELVAALDTLTVPGPLRERRVAAGRALFAGDAAESLLVEPSAAGEGGADGTVRSAPGPRGAAPAGGRRGGGVFAVGKGLGGRRADRRKSRRASPSTHLRAGAAGAPPGRREEPTGR